MSASAQPIDIPVSEDLKQPIFSKIGIQGYHLVIWSKGMPVIATFHKNAWKIAKSIQKKLNSEMVDQQIIWHFTADLGDTSCPSCRYNLKVAENKVQSESGELVNRG